MKKKTTNNLKKKLKRGKAKTSILVEMAEDFFDLVTNAKLYKKINKKK